MKEFDKFKLDVELQSPQISLIINRLVGAELNQLVGWSSPWSEEIINLAFEINEQQRSSNAFLRTAERVKQTLVVIQLLLLQYPDFNVVIEEIKTLRVEILPFQLLFPEGMQLIHQPKRENIRQFASLGAETDLKKIFDFSLLLSMISYNIDYYSDLYRSSVEKTNEIWKKLYLILIALSKERLLELETLLRTSTSGEDLSARKWLANTNLTIH